MATNFESFVDNESASEIRHRHFKLTDETEIIDIRAFQRTYEGAYLRTAMLEITLALSILRIFDIEFYPIGAVFSVIGFAFMVIGLNRRIMNNKYFMGSKPAPYFLTSGTPVLVMTVIIVIAYLAIIPEIFRLQ
ncbi:hypothetical protein V1514DRAFT_324840 [Lipomyces japonicus]|uniref:uncharacterized protein n=1 Tax=Lipomyces japonicus TaxID=56871 RepID=UPI0034CDA741